MIKIEQLKNGAKATYTQNGVKKPIFLHQLITHQDLATLEVIQGTVVYSVDEMEIKEQSAPIIPTVVEEPVKKLSAKEIAAQAKIAAKKAALEESNNNGGQ